MTWIIRVGAIGFEPAIKCLIWSRSM